MEEITAPAWSPAFGELVEEVLDIALQHIVNETMTSLVGLGVDAAGNRLELAYEAEDDEKMVAAAKADIVGRGLTQFALVGAGTVVFEDGEEEAVLILYGQNAGDKEVGRYICAVEAVGDENSAEEEIGFAVSEWQEVDGLGEAWL